MILKKLYIRDALRAKGNSLAEVAFRARYSLESQWCRLSGLANGLPVPPPRLTWLIANHYKIIRSLKNGKISSENIRHALLKNRLDINDFPEILDFGCGSGRILRNWRYLRKTRIYGTDYNEELAGWSRDHLSFAHIEKNGLYPPLSWADGKFSFIYAFSVFTHLDEPLQSSWMAELGRVLSPGGYLMITTHGGFWLKALDENQRAQFRAGQLVVINGDKSGSNYCGVYHPLPWVKEHMAKGFRIVDHIPSGATGTGMQDIYLLKKE